MVEHSSLQAHRAAGGGDFLCPGSWAKREASPSVMQPLRSDENTKQSFSPPSSTSMSERKRPDVASSSSSSSSARPERRRVRVRFWQSKKAFYSYPLNLNCPATHELNEPDPPGGGASSEKDHKLNLWWMDSYEQNKRKARLWWFQFCEKEKKTDIFLKIKF